MFKPIKLASLTKEVMSQGKKRKYSSFRPSRFYGELRPPSVLHRVLGKLFACLARNWPTLKNKDTYDEVATRLTLLQQGRTWPRFASAGVSQPSLQNTC